ncbi:MAG TPA: hypothetical protein VJ890_23375 [Vineibacter sp.]|nr:hypothetical protein [Vineibacter sp.]
MTPSEAHAQADVIRSRLFADHATIAPPALPHGILELVSHEPSIIEFLLLNIEVPMFAKALKALARAVTLEKEILRTPFGYGRVVMLLEHWDQTEFVRVAVNAAGLSRAH